MSQNFINFEAVPYAGLIPQAQPVGLCGTPNGGNVIPITINWADYPFGCVEINVQAGANVRPGLDQIRSCVIDNTFSVATVLVQFPDTNFTVVAEQDSVVSGFVLTKQQIIRVFNLANDLTQQQSVGQQTRIFLCDFIVDTYTQENVPANVALEAGSSYINSGGIFSVTPGQRVLSPRALGQTFQTAFLDLSTTGYGNGTPIMSPTPAPGALFIISSLHVSVVGNATDGTLPVDMTIGISGPIPVFLDSINWNWRARSSLGNYDYLVLDNRSGLNMLFSPLGTWRFTNRANALPGAFATLQLCWDEVTAPYFY